MNTVHEIERAIQSLSPRELEELYAWLDEHLPNAFDTRVQSDLAAGRVDHAIERALSDEKKGRTKSL